MFVQTQVLFVTVGPAAMSKNQGLKLKREDSKGVKVVWFTVIIQVTMYPSRPGIQPELMACQASVLPTRPPGGKMVKEIPCL